MNITFSIVLGFILILLIYFFFRSDKGWWFSIKKLSDSRERIILEDILKSLYSPQEDDITCSLKSLTRQLPFRESKIIKILDKMRDQNLVFLLNQQVRLSDEGKEYALRIIKAHRLWEHYLSVKTGHDKKDWHKLAEKAEHNLTDEHLEELSKELNRPIFDPHGSPIPYSTESVRKVQGSALSNFPKGTVGRIIEIEDEPSSIYKQILAEDIHLGAQIEIKEIHSNEIHFFSEGKEHRLPTIVANALTVKPLEEEEILEQLDHLSRLKLGEKAIIKGMSRECRGENRRRLLDLGFVKGTEITISSISPMQDPVAYKLRNTMIALRYEQSKYVLIEKIIK